jgi:hypothetical protein
MCVFVQADLPFSSQWRSALQVQGTDMQKLLLHCYIQEAGVDGTLMADALQQWRAIGFKAAALSSHQEILELRRELERVRKTLSRLFANALIPFWRRQATTASAISQIYTNGC